MTDVVARDLTPKIIDITLRTVNDPEHKFSEDQIKDIKKMVGLLKDFKGLMTEESVGATVYSFWHYFFHRSLFHRFTTNGKYGRTIREKEIVDDGEKLEKFWSNTRRLAIADNYAFGDTFIRMITSVAEGTATDGQNSICAEAYDDSYTGD